MRYINRTDAGKILAQHLKNIINENAVVLALPNGGIPIGLEIAKGLNIDFDLLFISKLTPKFNSEVGYGAVSESGFINLNNQLIKMFGITNDDIEKDIEDTKKKIASRIENYNIKKRIDLTGRMVILTDDGLASGYTMENAIITAKRNNPSKIIIAVPTAPLKTYNKLLNQADKIICPDIKDTYSFAVADAYEEWYDISIEKAKEFLQSYGLP